MNRFLRLSRSPFLTAIVTPVVFATALAYRDAGRVDGLRFLLTLVGLAAAHLGANLLNDYFDFRLGADLANPWRNRFSGGSPDIVEGREKAGVFLRWGLASLAVAAAAGAALAWQVDRGVGPVAWLALAGFACGFLYTAPPVKLVYRGLGEATIFLAFGVLPVWGTYYVQTGVLSARAFAAGLPLACLITNILWINEFPDHDADRAAGKRHLVVRLGLGASRFVYEALAAAAFLLIGAFSAAGVYGPWGLLGLAGLLPAGAAAAILHRRYRDPPALVPAQGLTIAAHLATGLLLTAGLLLGARAG